MMVIFFFFFSQKSNKFTIQFSTDFGDEFVKKEKTKTFKSIKISVSYILCDEGMLFVFSKLEGMLFATSPGDGSPAIQKGHVNQIQFHYALLSRAYIEENMSMTHDKCLNEILT